MVLLQTTALILGALLMILAVWTLAERASGLSLCRLTTVLVTDAFRLKDLTKPSSWYALQTRQTMRGDRRGSPTVQPVVAQPAPRLDYLRIPFEYRQ
jgi:hypothetical protein